MGENLPDWSQFCSLGNREEEGEREGTEECKSCINVILIWGHKKMEKGLFLLVKLRIESYTPRPVFCNCFAVFIMLKGNVNICYIYTLGCINDAFAWCTVWSSPVFPT